MNSAPTLTDSNKTTEELHSLLVSIGYDTFGIPIESVKEVIELTDTTMVPMCNQVIRGVINVRGSVIPVLDMQHRLMLKNPQPYNKYSCIVLYDFYDPSLDEVMTLGMLVSSVMSIQFINCNQLEDSPSFGANIPRHFVWKMAKINNQLTILLDMNSVLNISEINTQLKSSQAEFFSRFCQR
ncbi:purine-binding chemotaxis protein CheW [Pseudoalteromonas rubra]|uniref:Purine-binding chemotaxis protein CheW n=1 Tax=Pseudoalteromonas rubra TaxID=43658 RepID=A0A8T0CAA1_9GAMM|nr:chemotaxis protein CheW [Pseudoalteromonas rubra]KAF7787298.1 purine-binding chemotaxis protein CheW [Pseudoalteromonas rubra]